MTVKLAIDYLKKYENEKITDLVIDKNNNLVIGSRKLPLTKNSVGREQFVQPLPFSMRYSATARYLDAETTKVITASLLNQYQPLAQEDKIKLKMIKYPFSM